VPILYSPQTKFYPVERALDSALQEIDGTVFILGEGSLNPAPQQNAAK
jgi:hypothetical protein